MNLIRRVRYWLRQRRHDTDLADELRFHQEEKQRELERGGVSRREASFAARRAIGNVTLAREDARAVWIWPSIESVWQDVGYALRTLRRQPGFALVAIVTLGSAIGLNASLFTTFESILLRPWPVKDPSRVVNIVNARSRPVFTLAEYGYFAAHARSFTGFFATRCIDGLSDGCTLKLDGGDLAATFVSGHFFSVLGISAARGRSLLPDDDRVESPAAVVVISDIAWRHRFGQDPGVVGRTIRLDEVPFTVIGIAPSRFTGTTVERTDAWIPLSAMSLLRPHYILNPRRTASLAGRLADGVARDQARAELELLSRQYRMAHGLDPERVELIRTSFFANPARAGGAYPLFGLMLLAVLLVLLLACANVGNLLLARAAARRREIAVRLSLGAGRARLVRQLLTESLLLAAAASAVGIAIACALPAYIFGRFASVSMPLTPDATVLTCTAGLAIVTCIACGLAPSLHGSRTDVARAMAGHHEIAGTRLSIRGVLLAIQVATTIVLILNAGLLVRGVQHLATQDLGFAVDEVSVVSFELPKSYDTDRTRAFASQILARSAETLGQRTAGFASMAPFESTGRLWTNFARPGDAVGKGRDVLVIEVSPGYFDVLGIPIVAGRNLQPGDAARNAVLINESMADRFWPGENPIGQTLISGTASVPRATQQIVGVVKEARTYYGNISINLPAMYQPIANRVIPEMLVRRATPALASSMAALATGIEPRARVRITPLSANLDRLLVQSRIGAWLAGSVGLLALTLASVGLFSVFAYVVQQRTHEIGIRMALGARPAHVIRTVLGTSSRALAVGFAAGLAGAIAGSRLIGSWLYGVSTFDPVTYAGVAAILALAALAASYVPARRAAKVDPMVALRYD